MGDYLQELRERGKTSHVHREYQLIGLLVSQILEDEEHKSLYIKLARDYGTEKILQLAKSVAERKRVKNKGAYFMKMLKIERLRGTDAERGTRNRRGTKKV